MLRHFLLRQLTSGSNFVASVLPSPPLPSTSQDLHPGQHPESDVLAARYRQQARRDAATHPPSGQNDCQPGYLPSDKSFRPSWAARDSSLIQADDYRHPSHQHPLRADSYATRHGPHWPGSTATALSGPDFHQTPLRSHPAHTHVQPAVFSSSHIQSSTNGHAATLSLMHDFGYANAATTGVTLLDRRRASIQPMRRADRDALGRSGSPGPALAAPAPIRKHASQGFLVAYNGDSDSRARSPDGFPMHAPNAPVGNHSPTRPLPSADYPPQIVTKRASQACGIVAAAQAPLLACNTPGKTRLARPSSAAPDGSSSEQDFSPFSSDSEDDSVSDAEPDLPKDEVMQSRDQVQLAKSLQEPDRQHAVRRLRSTPEVGSSAQLSPAPHRPLRKTKGKPVPPPIASAPYSAFAPPQISVSAPGAGVAPGAGTCTLPTSGTKRAPTSWPNTPVKRNGPALSPPTPAALPASAAASFSGQPAAPHEHPQPELYPWSVPGKGKITSTCSRADSPLPALFQPRTSASHSKLGPGPDRSALVREPNHAHTRTNTGTQGSVGAESRIRGDGAAAEGGAKVRSRARSMNAAGQTSARPAHISWTSEGAPGPSSYRES